jgi:hypothetical protein
VFLVHRSRARAVAVASLLALAALPAATGAAAGAGAPRIDGGVLVRIDPAVGFDAPSYQKLDLVVQPTLSMPFGAWRATATARLRIDPAGELDVRREARAQRARGSRPWYFGDGELELRELFVDGRIGAANVRLGKQQVVWGQADGLRVLDVVNPFSFREFVLPAAEDRRIPLWTANVEWPVGDGTVQALWVADPTYDELPLHDQPFAFTSPLVVPRAPPGASARLRPADRPAGIRDGSDYGLRWQHTAGRWDLTLNWLYHRYDAPVPFRTVTPAGIEIAPRYERTHLVGGTASTAVGSTTLRAEFGHSTRRWFLTADPADPDGVYDSPESAWVVGVDYAGIAETLLSAQVFQSRLERRAAGGRRGRVESQATFLIQREFANDALRVRVLAMRSLDRGDGSVQATVGWQLTTGMRATAGIEAFYGTRDGLFGQFEEASRATLGVEWGWQR